MREYTFRINYIAVAFGIISGVALAKGHYIWSGIFVGLAIAIEESSRKQRE